MSFSFSNMLTSVMSNIPNTEANNVKVKLINNPKKQYLNWPLITEGGSLRLFQDVKGKAFECVFFTSFADEISPAYSIFRFKDETKSMERFAQVYSKLEPYMNMPADQINLTNLQQLCTQYRDHVNWSHAHVVVASKFYAALCLPAVLQHLNSQQCELSRTPLHLAVSLNDVKMTKDLIACGARVDILDDNQETVLHYIARLKDNQTFLLAAIPLEQANMNLLNKDKHTALNIALRNDNFSVAAMLVEAGANINVADDIGYPIHYAMKNQNIRIAKAIFAAHQDVNAAKCNKHSATALHWAKTVDFLELALKQPHNINETSKTGDTPLHVMVRRLRADCAQLLLCSGADPNLKGSGGDTALHIAARHNNLDLVNALIVFGADVNVKNSRGESPRHIAATQLSSKFSSLMGLSANVVRALHLMGAERCKPPTPACKDGCRDGGTYNGSSPDDEPAPLSPSSCELAYEQFFSETIESLTTCGSLLKRSSSTQDETDSSAQEEHVREKDTVLCLDGGGVKGLVLIQQLEVIEKYTGQRIVDSFDWISGTSTGGILALSLAYGYSVKETKKLYFAFKDAVFQGSRPYPSSNLEDFLKDCFGENTTMDQLKGPKVLVSGCISDRNPPALHFFRNFSPPDTSSSKAASYLPGYQPPPEPKDQMIWRAGRSSGAAPTYLPAMGRFLDGGLIANNPTLDTLTEISEYYMDRKKKGIKSKVPILYCPIKTWYDVTDGAKGLCPSVMSYPVFIGLSVREIGMVVSLGCGYPPVKVLSNVNIVKPSAGTVDDLINTAKSLVGAVNLGDIILELVCDVRGRSVDRSRAWCHSINAAFFRFSPPMSMDLSLDETRNAQLMQMLYETQVYIKQNEHKFQQLAQLFKSV